MPAEMADFLNNSWVYRKNISNELKMIILAAGLGKRMEPLTRHHLPKPMFPLAGKVPMTELWVRRSIESGITDISMNVCVLKNSIMNHFRDGSRFGAVISYVEEDSPSGTLGGVCKQALGKNAKITDRDTDFPRIDEFTGSTVIVVSGDIVTNFGPEQLEKMYDIHKSRGASFSMILTPVPWESRGEFGTVELEAVENSTGLISSHGKIIEFREKDPDSPSNLNNASIYMIEMDLLRELDSLRTEAGVDVKNPFYDFGKHVFPAMLGKLDYARLPADHLLLGIRYDGDWFDVGRKKDYLEVNKSVLDGKIKMDIPYEKFPWGFMGSDADIDFTKVRIIPPVIIGNNCIIEDDAVIGPYAVIGDNWKIGKNTLIENSVLWMPYSFHTEDKKIKVEQRTETDAHEVLDNVSIKNSLVVGGTVRKNTESSIINILENGEIEILDIDWVPQEARA